MDRAATVVETKEGRYRSSNRVERLVLRVLREAKSYATLSLPDIVT